MEFLDGFIVKIAKHLLGAVMVIGTWLVYLQFLGLLFLFVMAGTLGFSAFLAAVFGA
ncbi:MULTISPECIES: hypothetical protein [Pseudomonas syringae group]|uniref:Uncharacterized protein n=1 Tax=Pseudomonas syringae pv. persicae TaxID=237306 RepID=A0A3M3ZTL4_9PSED|nr:MULTISPECIES: hypothetical protein [Pseudomonas syringae group]QOQ33554.1 hypothetical protein [Pseudomonas syringae pv. actinidiae]RMO97941.1 hypothetical protein ALQ30_200150 [Pseudomonas syringae pv. persicae]